MCKSMFLAKALKIVILLMKNAYFQEIEDMKKERKQQTCIKKRIFLGTSILDRCFRGFGTGLADQNP